MKPFLVCEVIIGVTILLGYCIVIFGDSFSKFWLGKVWHKKCVVIWFGESRLWHNIITELIL